MKSDHIENMSTSLEKTFNQLDELTPSEQLEVIAYLVQKLKGQSPIANQSGDQIEKSALEQAQKWVGCIDDGPDDVSTNPRYLEDYGDS